VIDAEKHSIAPAHRQTATRFPGPGKLAFSRRKDYHPVSRTPELRLLKGRRADRLFVTPRGKPWTTGNAQETLQRLLGILGLPRFTLHRLRATGPVALKLLGFENSAIRALTWHTSDQNQELCLHGVDHHPLAKAAQEALDGSLPICWRVRMKTRTPGSSWAWLAEQPARRAATANRLPTSIVRTSRKRKAGKIRRKSAL
jgi:hypothetical protein